MPPMKEIEILARAVVVSGGKVLLCRTKEAENAYLPGGHIEWGEPAQGALGRELREELGARARVGTYLGAVEHVFRKKGKRVHEVNLVFRASIGRIPSGRAPAARESHIEFLWAPLTAAALAAHRLEPAPLRRLLPRWVGARASGWASTFRGP